MEDISQQTIIIIEIKTIQIKTFLTLTIGAAYTFPKTKILLGDLDIIIQLHDNRHHVIGGDFNAKHCIWNNTKRNSNGFTIKNHFELHNYQIIHSPTYMYVQTDQVCVQTAPSNIDMSLTNVSNLHNGHITDDLSSNHLPVEPLLQMHKISNRQVSNTITDWSTYAKLCSKKKKNGPHPYHLLPQIYRKVEHNLHKNRYRVLADYLINELDLGPQNTESQNDISNVNTATINPPTKKPQNVKPPSAYIHSK